jgi:hypothetical protein
MKKEKIAVAIYDRETKAVVTQRDFDVPDIFNVFDVCGICWKQHEPGKCNNCIVGALQMDAYFIGGQNENYL